MPYATILRPELRQRLQERYDDTPFWTDTDADLAINHSLRVWNLLTSYWRRRIVVASVADVPLVTIPGTLAQQTAVTWQGRPMTGVSVAELNMLASNWWDARVGDSDVPERPTFWAPMGLNLMAIYPAFTTVSAFEVDGVRSTPVLSADNIPLDVGPEELNILLGYMLHVAAIKAGGRLLARTVPGLRAFIEAAVARNKLLKLTAWYTHYQKTGYAWTLLPEARTVGTPNAPAPEPPQP